MHPRTTSILAPLLGSRTSTQTAATTSQFTCLIHVAGPLWIVHQHITRIQEMQIHRLKTTRVMSTASNSSLAIASNQAEPQFSSE
jgi:hypothetical protein